MDMTIDREFCRFKLQKEDKGMYILKCYYYEYYGYIIWRTYKDVLKFKHFDSIISFLRNNKPKEDETCILQIDMAENLLSFSMKQQLGPSRPYEFINQELHTFEK